ncbi:hypothetical protein A2690_02680 [Candidatus Roizmanbacteria bacterium RIFCSPHIGHO2_01_FULL_39_12b]|uniref:Zinc finger DksA/TraR C4-type domain-containing protein n=1 Tax=Candidatus Roizmanbacteria bacterium RIFCSPHIGHO2_01_FULL_39_12b TaxID=1802030 RepID=A0A1F7GBH7_9BACT|nr:MAG: hypothetical protein A2690_02680 [Candidatus Roizmanbacteria bacterium RIFCSPHIGHO2_01_FULL_39_12b]
MSDQTRKGIVEIQKKLNNKQEKLEHQIKELKKDDPFNDIDHVNDNAAVDTDVREQIGHDTIEATIAGLKKQLTQVEEALKRTFDGIYGLCVNCGKPIGKQRLELIPEAEHCIECHGRLTTSL